MRELVGQCENNIRELQQLQVKHKHNSQHWTGLD